MALTKGNVIVAASETSGFSKSKSRRVVEAMLEIMKTTLASGEDILITGFGKFCVKEKSGRKGRNPQTAKELMLDRRRVIVFKCSKRIRDELNKKI